MTATAPRLPDKDRWVALAFCWADMVFELDHALHIVFAAGATDVFVGRKPGDLVGRPLADIIAPEDQPVAGQLIKLALKRGRVENKVVRVRGQGGMLIPVSLAGYCLDGTRSNFFLAMHKLPREVIERAEQVRDPLTGLLSADCFADAAGRAMAEAQAEGERLAVSVVNIPGMDALASGMEPEARDSFRERVAELLRASSSGGGTAAEVADGRFGLLHAPGIDLARLEERLKDVTREADPRHVGLEVESTTVGMDGAEALSDEDLTRGVLYALNQFRSADKSLSLRDLSMNMTNLVEQAVTEVNGFKRVVSERRFEVAVQPIVNVRSGEIHHYEGLCRFDARPGESPYKYISFAEETGLIHEFDLAMAHKVVDWLGKWPRNTDHYNVAVNVSGFSIGQEAYLDGLDRLLAENTWTEGKLIFEITESFRMSDLDEANRFIQKLRRKGYHVCLDDFGAGAASFQYLSTLDVDVVKLDGSAVHNAMKASKGRAFLSALTELCRRLGVETIAEMVDSPTGLEFVRDCAVDYVQGFLFGRPSKNVKDFHPLPNHQLFQRRR